MCISIFGKCQDFIGLERRDSFPLQIILLGGTLGNFVVNFNFAAFINEKSEKVILAFPELIKK